jgi:hypothetical protein
MSIRGLHRTSLWESSRADPWAVSAIAEITPENLTLVAATATVCALLWLGSEKEPRMSPSHSLLNRVKGEFLEMPGLRLRIDQAQRLWNLDRASCELLLGCLVEAKFLRCDANNVYGMASTV